MLRIAERAVADMHLHAVRVAGRLEICTRALGELRPPLDRVHLGRELREHRGLVAGAGADVEYALPAAQPEGLADERNHVRLRDRLALSDRQRCVVVRTRTELLGDEELARHACHRLEHALVANVARTQLLVDHPAPVELAVRLRHVRPRDARAARP